METYISNIEIIINQLTSYRQNEIDILLTYFGIQNDKDHYCSSLFELANTMLEYYHQGQLQVVDVNKDSFEIKDPNCLGQLKIEKKLGGGSFGTVFIGKLFGKEYAIKIVQIEVFEYQDNNKVFNNENRLNQLFNEYNFGPIIYDYYTCEKEVMVHRKGEGDMPIYIGIIVYDKMDGNVKSYLKNAGYIIPNDNYLRPYIIKKDIRITPEEKVNILRLVQQTKKMHELGYGHFDMKLENCLYNKNPLFFTLSDFGLSKKIENPWDWNLDYQPYNIYIKSVFQFYSGFDQDLVKEATHLIGFPVKFHQNGLSIDFCSIVQSHGYNVYDWLINLPKYPKYNIEEHVEYYDYLFCYLLLRQFKITETSSDTMDLINMNSDELSDIIDQEIEKNNLNLPLPNYNKRFDYTLPYYPPRDPEKYKQMTSIQKQRFNKNRKKAPYEISPSIPYTTRDLRDISFHTDVFDLDIKISFKNYLYRENKHYYNEGYYQSEINDAVLRIKQSGNIFISINKILEELGLDENHFEEIKLEQLSIKHNNDKPTNLYIQDLLSIFYNRMFDIFTESKNKNIRLDIKSFQTKQSRQFKYPIIDIGINMPLIDLPCEKYNTKCDVDYSYSNNLMINMYSIEKDEMLNNYNLLNKHNIKYVKYDTDSDSDTDSDTDSDSDSSDPDDASSFQ